MTIKEFAESISGRQYPFQLTIEERNLAYVNDFIVVYGDSDDLVSFEGVFNDEASVMRNGTIRRINKKGILPDWDSIDHNDYDEVRACILGESEPCVEIKCLWANSEVPWEYEIDFPHEKFTIYEEDEIFCIGAVLDMRLLKSKEELLEQRLANETRTKLEDLSREQTNKIYRMNVDEAATFVAENASFIAAPVLKLFEDDGRIWDANVVEDQIKNNVSQIVRDAMRG